ncbi:MAG: cytochrome c oxidase subunit 3, partial [Acidobacteriota bacterium]
MENNKLGVLLFIGTEAFFFTLLILAYLYFLGTQNSGPSAANVLSVKTTGIFSLFLFSSSFTVWRAESNLKAGKRVKVMAWLLVTILFGITFLVGQGLEWTSLIDRGETVSQNLFGTTFFTLTGFH